jgi:alpha-ribazole phosphatase/probable phosphoglycerate mutase
MSGLIFIRHAETDLAGTFCGHSNPPVNARGHAQVDDLILRLTREPFDAIYSSDLRRAKETATSLARAFAVPCTATPNLREIYFGRWEAMTWAEIEDRDPDYARLWIESFPSLPAPGGELYEAFGRRVRSEIGHLLHLAENKRIAVVTHAGVMQIALRSLLGYTEQEARTLTKPYCSFFVSAGTGALREVGR